MRSMVMTVSMAAILALVACEGAAAEDLSSTKVAARAQVPEQWPADPFGPDLHSVFDPMSECWVWAPKSLVFDRTTSKNYFKTSAQCHGHPLEGKAIVSWSPYSAQWPEVWVGTFHNGRLNGMSYAQGAQPKSFGVSYKDGLEDGVHHNEDGDFVEDANWKAGKLEGDTIKFNSKVGVKAVIHCTNNEPVGLAEITYPDGNRTLCVPDVSSGECTLYNAGGKLVSAHYMEPRRLAGESVQMPPVAAMAGHFGTVSALVHVTAQGRTDSVKIIKPSQYQELDDACRAQLQDFQFDPATVDGKPVASYYWMSFTFAAGPPV